MSEERRVAETNELTEPEQTRWPPLSYWARVFLLLLALVAGTIALWTVRNVVLIVLASLVIATGLQPAIEWFEERGLKRGWGLAIVLMAGLIVMGAIAVTLIPFIAGQVADLIDRLPEFLSQLEEGPGFVNRLVEFLDLRSLLEGGENGAQVGIDAVAVASGVGAMIFNLVTVLLVTPYLAIQFPALKVWSVRLLRPKHREDFLYVLNSSVDLIANYMVGNLVISVIAGVVTFVGFTLLDVRFALALAVWVAFTDIIPAVGALLGAAGVAAVVAFQGGPVLFGALVLLVVYQQIENYVIAPRVMKRAIDLNAATVIIALLIGGSLAGLVGALLALPLAAMIKIIVFELIVPGRIESLRHETIEKTRVSRRRRSGVRPLP